jgi:hypothetical protein
MGFMWIAVGGTSGSVIEGLLEEIRSVFELKKQRARLK